MNENYNTPNSNCCGRPMYYNTAPKCNYNSCCMNEYAYKQKACIRNKQPDCEAQAVIPSITVETVDGITNLANCFVHVSSTNTTYYVDDKHRVMITWAGPVDIPGYDMEGNPNHYKDQIVTDIESQTAVIYDKHGKGYVFGLASDLDVQEEINNKLDEMYEDGTLQEIVADYLNSKAVFGFDSVAELKNATNLVNGSYAQTLGFHSKNDGGGSLYTISDTGTPNEKDIIACQNGLLAHLTGDGEYYPEQLGAYGDNIHNDTSIIQYTLDTYNKVKFYNKTYKTKGLRLSSNQTLKGNGTILYGENDTVGLMIYNDDAATNISYINIDGITLRNYTVGILGVNCTRSNFNNCSCNYCGTGARFIGDFWIHTFYNCSFNNNTNDGFEVGLIGTHPITLAEVIPNVFRTDFYSCGFAGNGGYGINGWMREFNFYGGHSELNEAGAVRIYSEIASSRIAFGIIFSGFDIENVNKGYVIEGSDRCEIHDLFISGGQIDLNGTYDSYKSALVFKGNSCQWLYNYNIFLETRITQGLEGQPPYVLYADGSTGSTVQIDVKVGNRNGSYLNAYNFNYIYPNGLAKINGEIPLEQLGQQYYNVSQGKIQLTSGGCLVIPVDDIRFVNNLKVKTEEANASLTFCLSGTKIDGYVSTTKGTRTAAVDSGENIITFDAGVGADFILIRNNSASTVTIRRCILNGYRRR